MARILILTGNAKRHRFFANSLAQEFEIVGVVSEAKRLLPQGNSNEENAIIKEHLRQREEAENKYFGGHLEFGINNAVLKIGFGQVNELAIFEWVKNKKPEYLILFGTSIIKPPLLSYFDGKIINIHLGLSPYYRGSGTNFWPLVNREPECVGATVHLAVLKVDAGPILAQVRPNAEIKDGCHDLGCKTIITGTEKIMECIKKYQKNEMTPAEQKGGGRLYKRADFNAEAVQIMWKNFKRGMMKEYLDSKLERDSRFPIIETI